MRAIRRRPSLDQVRNSAPAPAAEPCPDAVVEFLEERAHA